MEDKNALVIIICLVVIILKMKSDLDFYKQMVWEKDNIERVLMGNDYDINEYIPASDIRLEDGRVCVYGQYDLATFSDTDSMLPLIDYQTTGIVKPVTSDTPINLGDIITYFHHYDSSVNTNYYYVHRVIRTGEDENGTYYITQGDHNIEEDDVKVRKEDMRELLVGLIW